MQAGEGGQGGDQAAQGGHDFQSVAQGDQFTRPGQPADHAVRQPFQVRDALEGGHQLGAGRGVLEQGFDRVLAGLEAGQFQQGLADPTAQQAAAHRRHRAVEHAQQTALALAAADRLGQLQVTARAAIEQHEGLGGIDAQAAELAQGRALSIRQVVQDGPGGVDRQGTAFQIEAGQVAHIEVLQEGLARVAKLEVPVREGRQVGVLRQGNTLLGPTGGKEHLARDEARQLLHHVDRGLFAVDLGDGELAGGDVHVGQSGALPIAVALAFRVDGQQVIVAPLGQHARLHDGARRDHARDLARDEAVDRRVADLLADGHVIALVDQARDVVLGGVVRNTGHRHALTLGDRAAGEHQIQLAGGQFRVLIEGFVKVAQAEENNRVGILALDFQILATHGSDFSHEDSGFWLSGTIRV